MTDHRPSSRSRSSCRSTSGRARSALRAQLVRFVITGGLSAIVDFGLLVILMQGFGPRPHPGQGALLRRRHDHGVPDQPALDLPGRAVRTGASWRVVLLYALTFALQVGLFSLLFTLLTAPGRGPAARCR